MVLVPAGSFASKIFIILDVLCPTLQNLDDFDLFGDILESPDFLFARKRLKTAVASALNSNNNQETQR